MIVDDPLQDLLDEAEEARRAGRYEEAFGHYEAALQIELRKDVLLKMERIARKLADSVRLSRCLATLAQLEKDPAKKAEYLVRAAEVTRDGRGDPQKASTALEMAIRLTPGHEEAFSMLRSIYRRSRSWRELAQVYQRVIKHHTAQVPQSRGTLARLWGELAGLLDRLGRAEDARVARSMQSKFMR